MYLLSLSTKFKKGIKTARKRGLKMKLLDEAVSLLVQRGKLPKKYKPHLLKGNYNGLWECHIQPDWLLIWKQEETIKLISATMKNGK